MTDGYREILALRKRLARLEEMAKAAAQPPPADKPGFGDAIAELRRAGTASGSAIDALRAAVTGPRPTTPPPDPERLREATAILTGDLRGAPTIAGAFEHMKARASRLDALETTDPGSSGRVDPSDPAATPAADRLRRALSSEEH